MSNSPLLDTWYNKLLHKNVQLNKIFAILKKNCTNRVWLTFTENKIFLLVLIGLTQKYVPLYQAFPLSLLCSLFSLLIKWIHLQIGDREKRFASVNVFQTLNFQLFIRKSSSLSFKVAKILLVLWRGLKWAWYVEVSEKMLFTGES